MENEKYFILWREDKESMLVTMERNMAADIDAGYSPASIQKQKTEIENYKQHYDAEFKMLMEKTPSAAERWCKMDLLRRGAIEL